MKNGDMPRSLHRQGQFSTSFRGLDENVRAAERRETVHSPSEEEVSFTFFSSLQSEIPFDHLTIY